MIDFISVTKYLGKDSPFLGHCYKCAVYNTGWQSYSFQGCKEMKVRWNPESGLFKLNGSIMYYYQGHNFFYSREKFIEAIDHLQTVFQVNLWDAETDSFEYGTIIPVEMKPKCYIQNHHASKASKLDENERAKDKGCFRWWENKDESLKLYDAKRNMQLKQPYTKRQAIESMGYDPEKNYLKFEVHFKDPSMINDGLVLPLKKLVNPFFCCRLNQILLQQYGLLRPNRSCKIPTDKKNMTTADFLLRAFLDKAMNVEGKSPAQAHKDLFRMLNQLPSDLLSKADKDSRKRQINTLFSKIEEEPCSQWDLKEKIRQAILAEGL